MAKHVKIIGVPVSIGHFIDSIDTEFEESYFGAKASSKEATQLEESINDGWVISESNTMVIGGTGVLLYTLIKEDKKEED